MKESDDIVEYSNEEIMRDCEFSINTFGKAINELISAKLIARVSLDKRNADFYSYFINATYFFRGKKSDYYNEVYKLKTNLDNLKG
jgi:hypothetical protein